MNNENFMEKHIDLGQTINLKDLKTVETKVLFTLYFVETTFGIGELTSNQLFEFINEKLRLKTSIQAINNAISRSKEKISSIKKGKIRYHKIMVQGVDEIKDLIKLPSEKKVLDLLIPNEVVESQKDYFKKVIRQINGCYQDAYYDACFVMIRRAVETLIIDAYESKKKEDLITNEEGNYLPFKKLIDKTLSDNIIKLSKIAKTDLKKIKKLGDTAAHNRKLNLRKSDIDKYSDSIRLLVEELINTKL